MPSSPVARSGATRPPAGGRSWRTLRGHTRSGSPLRLKERPMATTAPEQTTDTATPGWLYPFLADWQPGTGESREIREPATGRPLLTLAQSTPAEVARAAAAAAA